MPVVQSLSTYPPISLSESLRLVHLALEALQPPRQLPSACRRDIYLIALAMLAQKGATDAPPWRTLGPEHNHDARLLLGDPATGQVEPGL